MTHTLNRRILVPSALLAGLGPLIGNGLYEGPTGSGDLLLAELREPLTLKAYAAIGLELLGFVALMVFVGVLAAGLARRAPVAAAVTAIAGSAMVAVKLATVTPLLALRLDTAGPDDAGAGGVGADVAGVLLGIGDAGFVVSGLLLAVAFTAAGAGLLASGLVPRWLAWWPAVVGVLTVATAGVGVAEPDRYVPVPFLLLLLWMIVLGVATATRRSETARQEALLPTQ
jgi:hypothetical protein